MIAIIISSPSFPSCLSLKSPSYLQPAPLFSQKPPRIHLPPKSKFKIYAALSSNEESRWEREEQRWLREEQRWLREESRWHSERDSLLREIANLKLQIENLERRTSSLKGASDTVANLASLLQVLKDGDLGKNALELGQNTLGQIAESGSGPSPIVLEAKQSEKEEEEVVVKEIKFVEEHAGERKTLKRATLRKGSEGEAVRVMQEALQKLGFYSGEEDTEFSSFSSGTESAVRTWQASVGVPEDGLMTAELLEILYGERPIEDVHENSKRADPKEKDLTNGAAVASVTEISKIQGKLVKESGATEVEESQHRVFLLGENRWEEPSRLIGRDKQTGGTKSKDTTTKCPACRGEGRLLCMECDGTGEPNIEEQFMEWVDGDAKCPYCDGLGYTICDLCHGKTAI